MTDSADPTEFQSQAGEIVMRWVVGALTIGLFILLPALKILGWA